MNRRIAHWVSLGMLLAGLHPQAADAGDWPFIQGPLFQGQAVEETLLPAWSEAGPSVLWTRELGQGFSSFAIVGNRCVTQYQSPLGQFVLCLDAGTGETLWEHRYALPYEALGIYPGPRATPTIAGDHVYFVAPNGEVGCVTLSTGRPVWSANPHQLLSGEGTGFGSSASVLVLNDLVIMPVGGRDASVISLHAANGELAWKAGSDPASYCPIVPIQLGGKTVLVSYLENVLVLHDVQGNELGRQKLSHGYDEHAAIPLWREPLLFVSAPFRSGATAYELQWKEETSGERRIQMSQKWQSTEMSNDIMTSVICSDVFCGFDLRDPQAKAHRPSRGVYRGLDVLTGETLWSRDNIGQCGAIVVGERCLLFSDRGEVLLTRPTREELHIDSRAQVFKDEVCWTRPALADGRLFVRTHSRAVCLHVGTLPDDSAAPSKTLTLADVPQGGGFASSVLLGGEREHPFTTIDSTEAWQWYLDCLLWCLLPAIAPLLSWRRTLAPDHGTRLLISTAVLFLAGVLATPLLNGRSEEFHFTWPASVYAAFQVVALCSLRATRLRTERRQQWISRLAVLAFLGLCVLYYQLLLWAGEPMEWMFLMGLAPAFPLTVLTVQLAVGRGAGWRVAVASWLGFSAFYWSAVGIQALRSLVVEAM